MIPVFANIDAGIVAMSIPIIAVIGGILIAITAVIVSGRKKELEHKERLIAMEKGMPLPEAEIKEPKPVYSGRRAGGLVLTGIGLALWIAISTAEGKDEGVWGLIPLFIGLGLLIASVLDKREYEREKERVLEEKRARGVDRPNMPTSAGGDYDATV